MEKHAFEVRTTSQGEYSRPEHDETQSAALHELKKVALCRKDLETFRAHNAVFDKTAELRTEVDLDKVKRLGWELGRLREAAAETCQPCLGRAACADYALKYARYEDGVFGGLTGTERKNHADDESIPQPIWYRVLPPKSEGRQNRSLNSA